ncbi:MAG: membrane protein insertion efficiency factor YidD [Eggerthellaceae bacterium]
MTGRSTWARVKRLPSLFAIALVRFYQMAISPLFPATCRFIPTCSQYALIALRRYGFLKGMKLAIKRILRCHPGGPYGFDPVP